MGCNAHLLVKSRAVFKLMASHQNLVSTEGKYDNIVTQIRNEWTIGVSLSWNKQKHKQTRKRQFN